MRMVRYAVWLARRWNDPAFRAGWPHFGTVEYWESETRDLEEQVKVILSDNADDRAVGGAINAQVNDKDPEHLTNKDYFWDWEDE